MNSMRNNRRNLFFVNKFGIFVEIEIIQASIPLKNVREVQ